MDYRLYYWDLPFRGVFIEMLLADVGAGYSNHDASGIYPERSLKLHNPGMAPPYLYDYKCKKYFAQMPAILMHLARDYDYLPTRAELHTLALKTILDCNDILLEITNYHGVKMWDKNSWEEFRHGRLAEWMQIFEHTGREHGVKIGDGYLLGPTISVADIAIAALFGTLLYAFPALRQDLQDNAPHIAHLVDKIEARDSIKAMLEKRRAHWGRNYCGGQIEKSLRKMLPEGSGD
ncbi:glutathione S-transferase family protein [Microbulbifer harenosus]|uniref:Glutathione S-transferase n=1 Tax=Microbulbifer harenosus TaxID=2576840 RepID=A0ABY2UHS4_9GAMM|nr:glutathione S-transferase family protein [Microbulbifer harenosus]TLM77395.1 glutathione S-transferase [Microbulbifer harenosus]